MFRQYIAGNQTFNTRENPVCAPLFKRVFDFSGKSARLEISVAGLYRAFLNGKEITKGYLAPYLNNPDQIIYYDEYDVLDLLNPTGNELIILLGNGFNSTDIRHWEFSEAPFRSAPKLYVGLYDGKNRVLTTDEEFVVYDSPITFDDYRLGEHYDARKEAELFQTGRAPLFVAAPQGVYKKCGAQPIRITQTIKPKKIVKNSKGYLYDFGENNAGVCGLKINGKAGQRVEFVHSEIANDNEIYIESIAAYRPYNYALFQREIYICKEGWQEYTPSFVYHGFRYVQVEGITESQATVDLLTFLVFHTDVQMTGSFRCSNEMVNKIQECTIRSDLSNFHYFPTDCPHREKNGWTGDIALSAEQMYYNFDATPSFKEWFTTFCAAQKDNGAVSCIVPAANWGYDWGTGMGWDTVMAELPYWVNRFTGDNDIVEMAISTIEKYLPYMQTKFNTDGLIPFGLGEWVEIGVENGAETATPVEVTTSLVCVDFLKKAAYLFQLVGKTEKAKEIVAQRKELLQNFCKKHVKDGWVTGRTQSAQVLALALADLEGEEEQKAYENLLALIKKAGNRLDQIGCFGLKYIFDVLTDHGDTALALKLLVGPEYPSYGYWIQRGATTLHEGFQEFEDSLERTVKKYGDPYLISHNHHFLGGVSAWMYKSLAGLKVLSPTEVEISPQFNSGLTWAEADFTNGEKSVKIRWEKADRQIVLTVENIGFNCRFKLNKTIVSQTTEGNVTKLILEQ